MICFNFTSKYSATSKRLGSTENTRKATVKRLGSTENTRKAVTWGHFDRHEFESVYGLNRAYNYFDVSSRFWLIFKVLETTVL